MAPSGQSVSPDIGRSPPLERERAVDVRGRLQTGRPSACLVAYNASTAGLGWSGGLVAGRHCRTLCRLRVAEIQAPIQKSRPATRAQMRNVWSERAPAKNRIPGSTTKMTSSANIGPHGANVLRSESVTTA